LEEHYEIVLFNYKELEKAALELSLENMLRGKLIRPSFLEVRFSLNVALMNLLSAARLPASGGALRPLVRAV
jgi:hypothetical protein